jgi:hypothetical protein
MSSLEKQFTERFPILPVVMPSLEYKFTASLPILPVVMPPSDDARCPWLV